jgi:nucleoside-diphosphate-sugar epimerase
MRVVITGGFGFVGSLLATELLARGEFRGAPIGELVLADRFVPDDGALVEDPRVTTVHGDLRGSLGALFAEPVDVVFHLASAVSAECERDFDLGLDANLDTTRALLDAARAQQVESGRAVVLVFSSSVAVYGSDPCLPLPRVVDEATLPMPQSSYGIHKFVCEQLVADYTRKGFIDGRAVRLMTVAVRPGRPNAAASGFLSGIIREPLAGLPCVCPVPLDTEVALSSPRRTVEGLLGVAEADRDSGPLRGRIAINLPALTVSVRQMLETLRSVAGSAVADLVTVEVDPAITQIVGSWPAVFDNARARELGLEPDADFEEVVRQLVPLG